MNCYIDTLATYIELATTPTLNNDYTVWKFFPRQNTYESHYFVRYKNVTCCYYPNHYGIGRIWLIFSIPKLLKGNNIYPITDDNIDIRLYQVIHDILSELFDVTTIPTTNLALWEVSRVDLFILHQIKPRSRKWYLQAYEKLTLGSYIPYKYKNTFYLNSTLKKHKAAGGIIRIYPKPQEVYDTKTKLRNTIPKAIEKEFEAYMIVNDHLCDYIRLEFLFRRQLLRYFFGHAKSVNVADVMNEQFQVQHINRMIVRLGLHRKIISRQNMKQQLKNLFPKSPTRQRAEKYISLVNSRGTYRQTIKKQFTEGQIRYIRKQLHDHHLHTIISEFEDLEPVQLLK